MKVKFEKDHLDNKPDDIVEVHDGLANYLQRTGVVTPHKEKKEDVAVTEKKTIEKPVTKKSK